MKFGIRIPSIKKRIAARTSVKRIVRHNLGIKMPRGTAILTDPKKAIYNKVYNQTSMSVDKLITLPSKSMKTIEDGIQCPNCNSFKTMKMRSVTAMVGLAAMVFGGFLGMFIVPLLLIPIGFITMCVAVFIPKKKIFCIACYKQFEKPAQTTDLPVV